MNTQDQNQLQRDLDAIEKRYRKLGSAGPPDLVDQAVLNRARRAVEAQPTRPWSFGWMHATATAALLVLGLTLVLQLRSQLEPAVPPATRMQVPIDAVRKDNDGRQAAGTSAAQSRTFGDLDAAVPAEAEEDAVRVNESVQAEPAARRDESDQNKQTLEQKTDGGYRERRAEAPAGAEMPDDEGADLEMFNIPATTSDEAAPEIARKAEAAPARQPSVAGQAELREGMEDSQAQARSERVTDRTSADVWLSAIVAMKNDDPDSNWLAELRQFVEQNPQYPLPESLQRALAGTGQP